MLREKEYQGDSWLNMKSRALKALLCTTIAFALVWPTIKVHATSIKDLNSKQQRMDKEKSEIHSKLDAKTSEINQHQATIETYMDQIASLDRKLTKTDLKIGSVLAKEHKMSKAINQLSVLVESMQQTINQRSKLLDNRARALQENSGSLSYVTLVLQSQNLGDFIDRVGAVNTLLQADRQILREQRDKKERLEEKQAELDGKVEKKKIYREQLELLRKSYDEQIIDKNRIIDKLEAEQKKLQTGKRLLEKEYSEAVTMSENVKREIEEEQQRLANLAAQMSCTSNAASSAAFQMETGELPEVTFGTWTKPAVGRLTSNHGWRDLGEGAEFHYGIDLANKEGTPVVAASDGVVFRASPLSTYGNVIMMTHSIERHIFTTVYAHLSQYKVSVGERVHKGQVIGYMGHTGRAYGSHLHFEIHTTPWEGQKVGAVNPLRYISF